MLIWLAACGSPEPPPPPLLAEILAPEVAEDGVIMRLGPTGSEEPFLPTFWSATEEHLLVADTSRVVVSRLSQGDRIQIARHAPIEGLDGTTVKIGGTWSVLDPLSGGLTPRSDKPPPPPWEDPPTGKVGYLDGWWSSESGTLVRWDATGASTPRTYEVTEGSCVAGEVHPLAGERVVVRLRDSRGHRSACDHRFLLFDGEAQTGALTVALPEGPGPKALAIDRTGTQLARLDAYGAVQTWNLRERTERATFDASSVAPHGKGAQISYLDVETILVTGSVSEGFEGPRSLVVERTGVPIHRWAVTALDVFPLLPGQTRWGPELVVSPSRELVLIRAEGTLDGQVQQRVAVVESRTGALERTRLAPSEAPLDASMGFATLGSVRVDRWLLLGDQFSEERAYQDARAVSPDQQWAVVAEEDQAALQRIGTDQRRLLGSPEGSFRFSVDGSRVVRVDGLQVTAFPVGSAASVTRTLPETGVWTLSADGSVFAIATARGQILVLDLVRTGP